MTASRHLSRLIEERLQESLQRFEDCFMRCVPAHGAAQRQALQHDLQQELKRVSTLAAWIHTAGLQDHLSVLEKLACALLRVGNNSRERLYCHLFKVLQRLQYPPGRDLLRLLQQRLARVNEDRRAGLAEPHTLRACPIALLQQASQFLHPDDSPGKGVMVLLACRNEAREQVHRLLHYRMQELAEACNRQEWTLDAFIRTGRAHKVRQLVQLAAFAEDNLEPSLRRVEQVLLRQHVAGGEALQVEALLQLLQGLILGRCGNGQLARIAVPVAMQDQGLMTDDAVLAELSAASETIRQALISVSEAPEALVSEHLLRACSRLGWMLDIVGKDNLGLAGHALAHTCVQFWQWRQPLTAGMLEKLQQFLVELQDMLAGRDDCCREPGNTLASDLLAQCPKQAQGSVPATAIAQDLAKQFGILVAFRQDMFATRESFGQHSPILQKELRWLEQGAAAVRLRELEQFTCQLLDIHHLLAVDCPENSFPAELLWQGHQHLLSMLDAAALWLEPLPGPELMQHMVEWVRNAETQLANAAASCAAPENTLQVTLTAFARKAGNLLGRPVRLRLDADELGITEQQALAPVVTELLRWILLLGADDSTEGSMQARTRSLEVQINCHCLPGAGIQVVLSDDKGNLLPDQRLRRRLQRLFPACGIELQGELQPYGKRSLSLVLALEPRHRPGSSMDGPITGKAV